MWITKFDTSWAWERRLYSWRGIGCGVSVLLLSSLGCAMIVTYSGGTNCCGIGIGDTGVGTVGAVDSGLMDMFSPLLLPLENGVGCCCCVGVILPLTFARSASIAYS